MIKITQIPEELDSYSVSEDATPLDPDGFSGGVGQLTFSLGPSPTTQLLIDKTVDLIDSARGKFQGVVRTVEDADGVLSVTADSSLALLNSWHSVPPYNGTLADYIQFLVDLVGITDSLIVDSSIALDTISVPGYLGNVWDHLKQFLSSRQIELALVFNRVVVRPVRTNVAHTNKITTQTKTVSSQVSAQSIEINWYESVWGTQREVFPTTRDESPIVVNANETVVQTYTIDGSLQSVNQPTVSSFVNDASYAGTNGVYAVAGSDGLPVTPSQWTASGGSLTVAVTDDPSVIEVTVHGADIASLAPFRIAMTAGTSSYYNALHITGTGLSWTQHTLTLSTGVPLGSAGQVVGTTVNNPYIQSLAQAYTAGLYTVAAWSSPQVSLSGSSEALVNGDFGSVSGVTFEIFNALSGLTDIASWNTEYATLDIAGFNAVWADFVSMSFATQLFGNSVGARILADDAYYRITGTTTDAFSVQYNGVLDTTIDDINAAWGGLTIADFNTQFNGYRFIDHTPVPLRTP